MTNESASKHASVRSGMPPVSREQDPQLVPIEACIEQAGQMLPMEGPISAFTFLNTLHAFEEMPFEEAVKKGGRIFGCQPYLSEDRYRQELERDRIRESDLLAVLSEDLGERANDRIVGLCSRIDLQLAMLRCPVLFGPDEELSWFVAETEALTRFGNGTTPLVKQTFIADSLRWVVRDLLNGSSNGGYRKPAKDDPRRKHVLWELLQKFGDSNIDQWSDATWEAFSLQASWRVCREGVKDVDSIQDSASPSVRPRDALLEATGIDSDALVHDLFIRFCAAFADQGFANWPLPNRDLGFFQAFCKLYQQSGGPPDRWLRGLANELARIEAGAITPIMSIQESLEILGIPEIEWPDFFSATMLALRGWASLIRQMEVRGDRVPLPAPVGTLVEFVAVRLLLERYALAHIAREHLHYEGPLSDLRELARAQVDQQRTPSAEQRAFLVFRLAQSLGWCPSVLHGLTKRQWSELVSEIESFASLERRRIFHLAFERCFAVQALDAVCVHAKTRRSRPAQPRFQATFCIDAREESFRRHLEEVAPDVETFSAAGFYSVAMYYRGVADAHFAALCPIIIRPKHWVVEEVVYSLEETNKRRAKTRRALGQATHQLHVGSRSLASGAVVSALGVLASIPLVARVLFPRVAAWFRKTAESFVEPPPITRLVIERTARDPGPEGEHIGFSVEEMANIGERVLRDIGLTSNFARLVLFLGHGSNCLNNPHRSAYDCGACSGGPGGANARALAMMLNDPRVREFLAHRNLEIPHDTVFLGGLHNTATDSILFFDLDLLPKSHLKDFEAANETLSHTCERNAHERCRRFDSAPLNLSLSAARRHVEGRAEDLAQTRPEFGNASNALCIVGRRERTRGLYLDRRSFMHSYDPLADDAEHTILARILSAVIPVCQGINLTYFFSAIDSSGWGCGTKLPHNVTSLLGVMDGAASDLRQGLPWQSVEIHEPIRLFFIIETTPEAMLSIMDRNPIIGRILRNSWAHVAVLDPNSSRLQVFRDGEFHPHQPETDTLPKAPTSIDWYRGWRNHLKFAEISA